MGRTRILLLALVSGVAALVATPAAARDFITLHSTHLGGGWFTYTVRMEPNPFFSTQIMGVAGAMSFTNRIDATPPPEGWTASTDTVSFIWGKDDQLSPHGLPFELTMAARSSSSGFRTETNFFVGYLLWFKGWLSAPGILSGNVAGYVKLPALVPCEPSESDGSPTELVSSYEVFPDPAIVDLGRNYLNYFWPGSNTVVIEASEDLRSWSVLDQCVGQGGTSTWFAAESLPLLGRYFRVGLVAMRDITTAPDLLSAPSDPANDAVFHRLTADGLIVTGPRGPILLPTGEGNSGHWCLPVSEPSTPPR